MQTFWSQTRSPQRCTCNRRMIYWIRRLRLQQQNSFDSVIIYLPKALSFSFDNCLRHYTDECRRRNMTTKNVWDASARDCIYPTARAYSSVSWKSPRNMSWKWQICQSRFEIPVPTGSRRFRGTVLCVTRCVYIFHTVRLGIPFDVNATRVGRSDPRDEFALDFARVREHGRRAQKTSGTGFASVRRPKRFPASAPRVHVQQ